MPGGFELWLFQNSITSNYLQA